MDKSSVSLIAERMGWSYTYENGPEWYVTNEHYKEYDIVAETNSVTGEWELNSAGAFDVLVEMGLVLTPNMHSRRFGDCFACGGVLEKSAHECVALAALAMIEEGE